MVHARPEYRSGPGRWAGQALNVPLTMARRGLLWPWRPLRATRQLTALLHWGTTLAGGLAAAAARDPDRTALVDEKGELSYAELHDRTDRLAAGLIPDCRGRRLRVAVLCRNHRGLVESLIACSKRGAEVVLLGTGLGPGQLNGVMRELWADIVIADAEFADLLPRGGRRFTKVTAWADEDAPGGGGPTLEELIEATPAPALEPPPIQGRVVFLSSGTSGRPKGARRPPRPGFVPLTAMLARTPLRVGDRMLIEAPLFHAWGYSSLQLALAMRGTVVLGRRSDPERTLATIQERSCTTLVTVPIMLQRLLALPERTRAAYDTSSLRITAVSGSRLPGDLATAFMDAFSVELCNVYGSTEAGWVSIATAADLRAHPDTAGRPASGAEVAILDAEGRPVPRGATGRIYVAGSTRFEGYTGGVPVETRDGMLFMGDVGHLDDGGLLYVDGRADEMIVSGGENVFPAAAEDVIARLPQVREVAVTGVPDEEYGERLAAYIVMAPGARLDADTVRGHVRERLARYAVPRDVHFRPHLPRNAMGKVVPHRLNETAGA
ncbi:AMP-binding protein [Actinoallomurus sp. CA-142502]|uniref:AMP-binding protein n=1 Tax=Actinoallomurus sp. CA-142502 TaxID=3239885 RepID=UPI003D89B7F6